MNSYPFQPSFGEEERAKKPGKPGGKPGKPGNGKPEKPGNGGDQIFDQYSLYKNVKDIYVALGYNFPFRVKQYRIWKNIVQKDKKTK